MTLTIELTPEQESTLTAEATARGLELPEFVKLRALEGVPAKRRSSARGEFAHVATSSEDFARRKQEEIRREEARW
jgi:hypothetical protein